jgi:diguanylate cyclase (GGDEF)-like protein
MNSSLKMKIKRLFTSNMDFTDKVSYRRAIMINAMLIFLTIIFVFFAFVNYFILQLKEIALLDFLSAFFAIITLLDLRTKHNVKRAAVLATIILNLFLIAFLLVNQNEHFGIVWVVFVPILSILFNGKKVGTFLTIVFFLLIYSLAYNGIGVWNNGQWNLVDMIRLVSATMLLTYVMYMVESAHEMADKELEIVRKHERKILLKLQTQAVTDELTQMYNRRYFSTIAPAIINTARRQKQYLTFFILDIDYFKKYNDFYGHQAGDTALKLIAKELKTFIQREDDFVFRLGGEEFAGIIHSADKDETKKWLQNLTKKIEDLHIEHVKTKLEKKILTISCGVFTTKVTKNTTIELLYKMADEALYNAKESGRNKMKFVYEE